MTEKRTAPPTDEGWYVLHDSRSIDWDRWNELDTPTREETIAAMEAELATIEAVEDAPDGASAWFVGLGHDVDLFGVHFRPTLDHLEALKRQLTTGEVGRWTDHEDSFVSVTEVSGYLLTEYFEEGESVDPGLERYIHQRLYPSIPDAAYVSFYPMSKRRAADANWYTLSFEDRAEHLDRHGTIGKTYAGKVSQVISGAIGFDDWEWGVTLFAIDPTNIKHLLYDMRFEPGSAKYADFGPFVLGRRIESSDIASVLAGEPIGAAAQPTAETDTTPSEESNEQTGVRTHIATLRGGEEAAVITYCEHDRNELEDAVADLTTSFDRYDSHVGTRLYASDDRHAVVSRWDNVDAAETAANFLGSLPGAIEIDDDGWETVGLFYTVKPDHREAFRTTFDEVAELLENRSGHRDSELFVALADDCDMFIASRWDDRADALEFFATDAFAETLQFGRDVLQTRPRHMVIE